MALPFSEPEKLGWPAPDFELLGTDGTSHRLGDFRNAKVLVIVFIRNHCPNVQAVRERINDLARDLEERRESQLIAINSEDGCEAMQEEVAKYGLVYPYLWDKTQEVARAYGAMSTPEFFLFDNIGAQEKRQARERRWADDPDWHYAQDFMLRYRGDIDGLPSAVENSLSRVEKR